MKRNPSVMGAGSTYTKAVTVCSRGALYARSAAASEELKAIGTGHTVRIAEQKWTVKAMRNESKIENKISNEIEALWTLVRELRKYDDGKPLHIERSLASYYRKAIEAGIEALKFQRQVVWTASAWERMLGLKEE